MRNFLVRTEFKENDTYMTSVDEVEAETSRDALLLGMSKIKDRPGVVLLRGQVFPLKYSLEGK